jgi:hypothetical protein
MTKKIFFAILIFLTIVNVSIVLFRPQKEVVHNPVYIDPVVPEPPKDYTIQDAVQSITADELKGYVEKLSSKEFEGRLAGTKGNNDAAQYIKTTLSNAGLKVEYQPFTYRNKKTQNICAWIEGESDQVIIIGAHYDHLGPGYPGADDNASGTAVVMAAAKACSLLTKKAKRTLVFQLYSAEESGLIGSRYYVQHPTFPKSVPDMKKCVFMLNLDMVGYMNNLSNQVAYPRDSSPEIKGYIDALTEKYPFSKSITNRGGGGSDQTSFLNAGVPIVWLFTGMHKNYHKSSDTAEKLNYEGMQQIARYALELFMTVAQSEKCMEFNSEGFKPIEKGLDHNVEPFLPDNWN